MSRRLEPTADTHHAGAAAGDAAAGDAAAGDAAAGGGAAGGGDAAWLRRAELAVFLRNRRARLDPAAVGLPRRSRSRTPGLRREDVAERAGVSVAWYTSLEQARPINPSPSVVAAVATALQLNDPDRDYLFALAGLAPPPAGSSDTPDVALLQQLVDRLDAPAYCTDAVTRVLAWNIAAAAVFGDYSQLPPPRRTLLHLLFDHTDFARLLTDRDDYAARVVHAFRGRSQAPLTDPDVIALVAALSSASTSFRQLWNERGVRHTDTDSLTVDHPRGRLTFTLLNLRAARAPGVFISAYLPADNITSTWLANTSGAQSTTSPSAMPSATSSAGRTSR